MLPSEKLEQELISALNDAKTAGTDKKSKIAHLRHAEEILLHRQRAPTGGA